MTSVNPEGEWLSVNESVFTSYVATCGKMIDGQQL